MKLQCQRGTPVYPYCVAITDYKFGSPNGVSVHDVEQWCFENFGHEFQCFLTQFFFKTEEDRTLFVLRWS